MSGVELSFPGTIFWLTTTGVQIAIGVASFRRSRCLSRYPIWQSLLVGFVSGTFAFIWLLMWTADRKVIAADWDQYRDQTPLDATWLQRMGLTRTPVWA